MKNLNGIVCLQYFVLCFCVLLASCSNDPKIVETFVSRDKLPLETIKQAELLYTEKGKVKVKILAQKIERFTKPNPTINFSEGIVVYFYNDSSIITSISFQYLLPASQLHPIQQVFSVKFEVFAAILFLFSFFCYF